MAKRTLRWRGGRNQEAPRNVRKPYSYKREAQKFVWEHGRKPERAPEESDHNTQVPKGKPRGQTANQVAVIDKNSS